MVNIEHPMELLESNTIFGLGLEKENKLTEYDESMVNYFLLHYDANAGNPKEQQRVLSGVRAYFHSNPVKMNAVIKILTE